MPTEEVIIHWFPPISVEELLISRRRYGAGLYYITTVEDDVETSLYIGMTDNDIKSRIRGHENSWLSDYNGEKYVRIGKVVYKYRPKYGMIYDIESGLIYEHSIFCYTDIQPANIDKKKTYTYYNIYRIINQGDRFELKPIVDMNTHPER